MDLYARLNILGGHSVRLPRGDLDDAIRLDNDPISRAKSWAEQGADVLHVVDLDAAAHRDYRNRPMIDDLIKALPIPVQVAGGIRSPSEAARLIDAGAHRVVMGTAAIEDQNMVWDLCRDHPGKIGVSIDVRPDGEIAIRGWAVNSGRYLDDVLLEMSDAGVTSFLVAEAGRDALLEPPNAKILARALEAVDDEVIAAGGVRHLEDLRALRLIQSDEKQLQGVIVGREVTHGRFSLLDAKAVVAEELEPVTDDLVGSEPDPDPDIVDAAEHYRLAAAELERAAAHARTASRRLLENEVSRGHTHGLALLGNLKKAEQSLDAVAIAAAARSTE